MRDDLDNKLCVEFPQLYRQRHMSQTDTLLCWGFACDDGWFDLIYDLSKKLDNLFKINNLNGDKYPACVQVKQKFGYLRYYTEGVPYDISKEAYEYIEQAERDSSRTCEVCGASGSIRNTGGWYQCLCEEHYQETKQTKK